MHKERQTQVAENITPLAPPYLYLDPIHTTDIAHE